VAAPTLDSVLSEKKLTYLGARDHPYQRGCVIWKTGVKIDLRFLYFAGLDEPSKMLKRSIKGRFSFFWETTAWKLSGSKVIGNTLAAVPFSWTRVIRTLTLRQILFLLAFHSHFSVFLCFGKASAPYSRGQSASALPRVFKKSLNHGGL
jgi:hypothetical protein